MKARNNRGREVWNKEDLKQLQPLFAMWIATQEGIEIDPASMVDGVNSQPIKRHPKGGEDE